jgi:hypothetical protein
MIPRFRLVTLILLFSSATLAAPGSLVETKYLESAVLKENRIGLNPTRRIKVYLPPGYAQGKARYPVIYMLHSMNWDNERMFAPGTAAQPTFDRAIAAGVIRPFIAVAPDYTAPGPGSMFANSSTSGRFEDHTVQEVVPFIDSNYRTAPRAESRAIMGDMMGAYGAMRYAFDHPDVFSVVYGMHPVGTGSGLLPMHSRPDWNRIHAARSIADLAGDPYSPVFVLMAQTFLSNADRPPFYCDFMVEPVNGVMTVDPDRVVALKARFSLENVAASNPGNLKRLRGIKFDWGRYDPNPDHVVANQAFTRRLDDLGIEHEAEEFRGLPWDKYWIDDGRVYTAVLPFFARRLVF